MYRLNKLLYSLVWVLGSLFLVIGSIFYLGWSQSQVVVGADGVDDERNGWWWGNLVLARGLNLDGDKESDSKEMVTAGVVEGESGTRESEGEGVIAQVEGQEDVSDEERGGGGGARDARAILVANFIERNDYGNDSPLQPYDEYGRLFVDIADEFGLDFRLLPALARKESTFCKSNIGRKYYNCFGYGVPASGITDAGKFTSYEEGIRTVAASLKRNYLDKGLTSPEEIMKKYCPPAAAGSGSWADHLNQWMAEMRYDDKKAGVEKKESVDLTEMAVKEGS